MIRTAKKSSAQFKNGYPWILVVLQVSNEHREIYSIAIVQYFADERENFKMFVIRHYYIKHAGALFYNVYNIFFYGANLARSVVLVK